jgi:hypothetical protein
LGPKIPLAHAILSPLALLAVGPLIAMLSWKGSLRSQVRAREAMISQCTGRVRVLAFSAEVRFRFASSGLGGLRQGP